MNNQPDVSGKGDLPSLPKGSPDTQAPEMQIPVLNDFGMRLGDIAALMSAIAELPEEYQMEPNSTLDLVPPRTFVHLAAQGIYLNRKEEPGFTYEEALQIAERMSDRIAQVPTEATDSSHWGATRYAYFTAMETGRDY